jgi:cell division protein FtsZ
MNGMGYAMMGTATGKGENAAIDAARLAIGSPLMEEGGVEGARGILINITGSSHLSLHDVNEACSLIRTATKNDDVQLNFGVVMSEEMKDEVKITVIATGFERQHLPELNRRPTVSAAAGFQPIPSPPAQRAVEPEPVIETSPMFEQMAPEPAPPMMEESPIPDIDVPAYLRRDRRLYQ